MSGYKNVCPNNRVLFDKVPILDTMWMNLENVMVIETS
jgi:hypothetical protein